jgi:hypothetical protein
MPMRPVRLRVRGVNAPAGQTNAPVMVRNRVSRLGYVSNDPGSNGGPGSPIYPYIEDELWNATGNSPGSVQLATGQIDTSTNVAAALNAVDTGISVPNGQSPTPWKNPTTYAGFPIIQQINVVQQVLNSNARRNSLLIQNNSTPTDPTVDTAPTLYVGFNYQPALNNGSLAMPPGLGFYWSASDCPPRDNILCVFLGGVGNFTIAGSVIQGTMVNV